MLVAPSPGRCEKRIPHQALQVMPEIKNRGWGALRGYNSALNIYCNHLTECPVAIVAHKVLELARINPVDKAHDRCALN